MINVSYDKFLTHIDYMNLHISGCVVSLRTHSACDKFPIHVLHHESANTCIMFFAH